MRHVFATLLLASVTAGCGGGATVPASAPVPPTLAEVRAVSPALEQYTQGTLLGGLWKRPELSPRDRSIVTLSVLIARGQTIELPFHVALALDNGVKPAEISEIVTHLAFYTGWANGTAAIPSVRAVFAARKIGPEQLPPAVPELLPLDETAETKRAAQVEASFGAVSPGVVQFTGDPLFRELWRRPALAPRDRSLVTFSALVATAQTAQVTFHLNRAMDNGLTRPEVAETLTQLSFYAGWPNVFTAMPVVKEVFEKRAAGPAPGMAVTRGGSQPTSKGPASTFTGDVAVTPVFAPNAHRHSSAGSVTFSPGARSFWHTHPAGQTLVVTAGTGWVQEWGGARQEIKAGDVIWTPPGVKHWHGAVKSEAMTHLATQEPVDGKAVEWLEPVSDAQYRASPPAPR